MPDNAPGSTDLMGEGGKTGKADWGIAGINLPHRVRDKFSGDYGTAVEYLGRHRFRVEWDDPRPYQATARARIPGPFFDWVRS